MPFSAMRHGDFFHLAQLGGPKLRSLTTSSAAALFHAALKTLPKWQAKVAQIDSAAADFFSLVQVIAGLRSPEFWDSEPIAVSLREAFPGFPKDSRLAPAASALVQKLTIDNGGSCPLPGSSFVMKKSIQKLAYDQFMDFRFNTNICELLHNRCGTISGFVWMSTLKISSKTVARMKSPEKPPTGQAPRIPIKLLRVPQYVPPWRLAYSRFSADFRQCEWSPRNPMRMAPLMVCGLYKVARQVCSVGRQVNETIAQLGAPLSS